ncbi:MAG TPA: transposase [Gemmataceae bacterium]|nr:transposase [Gemmataceae bacterium]
MRTQPPSAKLLCKPRRLRCASGGFAYHVLNRAVGRGTLFDKSADYAAFEKVLRQAQDWQPMRLLAYCAMPNHWHLLLWPHADGDLSEFMRWLTVTHTQRWHAHHHTSGTGPLYQGRFKSFPIEADEHLLTVCRYVERNPLRAGLVRQAQAWRWGSLWHREHDSGEGLLSAGPVPLPEHWVKHVNRVQSQAELEATRRSLQRGCPFGAPAWQERTAKQLGLESTLRPRGRPAKGKRKPSHN